ncbi:hypothetical protein J4206_04730 [Candidatus Woesearchaeota archaeon]|nr:hypothetical protein [Candidatus Woesearchaeota archaeon]
MNKQYKRSLRKDKKAILCHIIPIAIVVGLIWLFIFAIKLTYVGECTSNADCGSNSYCGSDRKCHSMPTKVNRDFTSAVIILSISLIIAFILLVWKKKEKVSEKISVSDSGLNKYHPTAHHQAHHMPNQIPNVHHTTSHEQKNNP